MNPVAWQLI